MSEHSIFMSIQTTLMDSPHSGHKIIGRISEYAHMLQSWIIKLNGIV